MTQSRQRVAPVGGRRIAEDRREAPIAAQAAYDLFADRYDEWVWQEFWHRNEWPHVDKLIASAPRSTAVLDAGTGTGFYLRLLQLPGRSTCGVDISHQMLRVARQRVEDKGWLIQADVRFLPFRSATFDVILLNRVASHLADLPRLVEELSRVLSQPGRLIVSDIAPEHDYSCTEFETPGSRVLVETHKHRIDNWSQAARSAGLAMTHQHVISACNAEWLPDAGFTSIDRSGVRPIGFVLGLDRV